MKNFKKILISALAAGCLATAAFGIAACNAPDEDNPDTPDVPGEATVYTVTFETDGGTLLPVQGANPGDKAVKPGDPKKAGYIFGGWYKNAACTQAYDFTKGINADTTVYAKWDPAPTTDASFFRLTQDGETWSVGAVPGKNLPQDVVIPSEIDGKKIASVSASGFEDVGNVHSVTLPDSITSIGERAFRNCSDLEAVIGGANIETIGSDAFDNTVWDNSLSAGEVYLGKTFYKYASSIFVATEIEVREGTVGIASGAFLDQPNLTGITLPEGLKTIGSYAFGASSEESANRIASLVIPDSVVEIGAGAFRYAPVETLVIGKGVEYIGANAFAGAKIATLEYNAANGVIANAMFSGMTAPASVKVASTVKTFPENLFKGWTGLTSVDLGTGITTIPAAAFDGLSNLFEVKFGDVERIGNNAFRGTALTELTLPESLTRVGSSAFEGNKALEQLTYNAVDAVFPNESFPAFRGCDRIKTVVIGNEVKTIPDHFLAKIFSVSELTLGAKIQKIGVRAFYGASLSGKLVFPSTLTTIGESAFDAGDETGGESFGTVGEMKLSKVVIPASVTEIGADAFANNVYLTALDYNTNGVTVGESAFGGCKNLEFVTLGANVTTVPAKFLMGNTKISEIDLDNVTEIKGNAFSGCTSLASIGSKAGANLISISSSSFTGTPFYAALSTEDGPIYLGKILLGYQGTVPETLSIKAGTVTVASSAFSGKKELKTVTFPTSLTTIEARAFYNCSGLTSLSLSNVERIGDNAFYGCKSIQKITWGSRLRTIGASAFEECWLDDMAEEFTIPKSVESIGERAFMSVEITGKLSVEEGSTLKELPKWCFNSAMPTEIDLGSVETLGIEWCGSEGNGNSEDKFKQGWLSSVTSFNAPNLKRLEYGALGNLRADLQSNVDTEKLEYVSTMSMYGWQQETVTFGENISFGYDEEYAENASIFARYHTKSPYGNKYIKKIVIKGALEEIPAGAFYKTEALEEVVLEHPEALKTIGERAFQGSGVQKIDISHVTNFGDYAFSTSKLTIQNPEFDEELYNIGEYAFDSTNLTGEVILGQKLTVIPTGAFVNPHFTKLTVKGNIEELMKSTFVNNSETYRTNNIKEVVLEEGVKIIDKNALGAKDTDSIITLPSTIRLIGNLASFGIVKLTGYFEPTDLSADVFGASAVLYAPDAETAAQFKGSSVWESFEDKIVGPDGVTGDGWILNEEGALRQYVGSKTEIVIPQELKSFTANQLFHTAEQFQAAKTISVDPANENFKYENGLLTSKDGTILYYYNGAAETTAFTNDTIAEVKPYAFAYASLTDIALNHVETLGANAFSNTKIVNLSLNALGSIGNSAFNGWTTLKTFSASSATSVGNSAFSNCSALTTVMLSKVETVGNTAFQNCVLLETFTGGSVKTVGSSAFNHCDKLAAFDFGKVEEVGTQGFCYCAFTEVNLPKIKTIGASAFRYLMHLTKVTIGADCTSIGNYAFVDGTDNYTVTCNATTPPTCVATSFGRPATKFTGTIYVPSEQVSAYQSAPGWSSYSNKIQAIEA